MIEWAETALLESLGMIDVYGHLPRVHVTADFKAPLKHRDLVDVELRVADVGTSSISYEVEFRSNGRLCVSVHLVAALVDERRRARRWPDQERRLLLSAGRQPAELLAREEPPGATDGAPQIDNVSS